MTTIVNLSANSWHLIHKKKTFFIKSNSSITQLFLFFNRQEWYILR